jgi:hypothetical protein
MLGGAISCVNPTSGGVTNPARALSLKAPLLTRRGALFVKINTSKSWQRRTKSWQRTSSDQIRKSKKFYCSSKKF